MMRNLQSIRERIACAPKNRRGYRQYDRKLRRDIEAHAARRLVQGASNREISEELGMADATLLHWCKNFSPKQTQKRQSIGFRPVEVTDEQRASVSVQSESGRRVELVSRPVVVLPSGVRIEGISLAELAGFLGRLEC